LTGDFHSNPSTQEFELPFIEQRLREGKRTLAIFYEETYLPEGIKGMENLEVWYQSEPLAYEKDPQAALRTAVKRLQKEVIMQIHFTKSLTGEGGPAQKFSAQQEAFQQNIQQQYVAEEPLIPQTGNHLVGSVTTDYLETDYDILLLPYHYSSLPPFLYDDFFNSFIGAIPLPPQNGFERGSFLVQEYDHPNPNYSKKIAVVQFSLADESMNTSEAVIQAFGSTIARMAEEFVAERSPGATEITILSYLHKELPNYWHIATFINALEKGLQDQWNTNVNVNLFHQFEPIEEKLVEGVGVSPQDLYRYYQEQLEKEPIKGSIQQAVLTQERILQVFTEWEDFQAPEPRLFENLILEMEAAQRNGISFFEFYRSLEGGFEKEYLQWMEKALNELFYDEENQKSGMKHGTFGKMDAIEVAINLTRAKTQEGSLDGIQPVMGHAIRYFRNQEQVIPIFFPFQRSKVSQILLQRPLDDDLFDRQLSSFMPNIPTTNAVIRPSIIADLIDTPLSRAVIFENEVDPSTFNARSKRTKGIETQEALIADRTISTYDSDTVHGAEDQLNITPDVNSFAYLIASKKLQPPLSIGLFGDWGSGKSFFMYKLEEKIASITQHELLEKSVNETGAAGDPNAAPPIGFHKHIVQIRFNAWYYIDANLWASLVTTIFERLSTYVGNKTKEEQEELELLKRLKSSQEEFKKAEEKLAEASEAVALKKADLDAVREDEVVKKTRLQEELKHAKLAKEQAIAKERSSKIRKNALTNQISRLLNNRIGRIEKLIKELEEKRANTRVDSEVQIIQGRIEKLQAKLDGYKQIKDLKDPEKVEIKVKELDALSEQQSQLFQDLSTTHEQLQEAWAEHEKAVTEEKRIQTELATLAEAREKHQEELKKLLLKDIYKTVKADPKLKEFIQHAKDKLQLDDQIDEANIEDIQKAIDEQLATRNRFHEMWNFFKTDLKKPRARFLFTVYVLLGLFLVFVLPWILRNSNFLTVAQEFLIGITTLVAAGVAAFNKFFKSVSPHLNRINEGLRFLEAAKERFKNQEKLERELLDKQIQVIQKEYDRTLEAEKIAREKLHEASKKVDAVVAEMQAIRRGKRLASFIERRLTSNDYQQYLGLISLIRNDFDKLSTYLRDLALQASEEKKVERIVLYIDDLDRCPPEKVVDVLQAIHLILAFPLFVIVVGVDVRWITKSLIRRYGFMISQYDDTGRKTELPAFYRDGATPYSYLEKIFQIPFRLKPLDNSGKSKMIRHLLEKDIEEMTTEEQLNRLQESKEKERVVELENNEKLSDQAPKPVEKPNAGTENPPEEKDEIGEVKE
ncbi:MAG: P-loop NTPase fold protein, partial [Bacteroidota bacterium]